MVDKLLVIGGRGYTSDCEPSSRSIETRGSNRYIRRRGEELIRMLENVRDTTAIPRYDYRQTLGESEWGEPQLNTSLYALGVKKDPTLRRKVFINYRRTDSNPCAYLIRERLRQELDKEDVFLDHESIELGSRFENVILAELNRTKVFLCIIGPAWLTTHDKNTGQRRLDSQTDFVRREIEVAVRDGIRIIPVCVEGATMPAKTSLPPSISTLSEFNACLITQDDIDYGIGKVVIAVRQALNG